MNVLIAARLPPELVTPLAAVPLAIGVLAILVGVLRAARFPRRAGLEFAAGIGLGLEFLLAAGLLRLAATDDLRTLAMVALIIVLRRLAGTGIKIGARAGK